MAKALSSETNVKSFLDLLNTPALRDTARLAMYNAQLKYFLELGAGECY